MWNDPLWRSLLHLLFVAITYGKVTGKFIALTYHRSVIAACCFQSGTLSFFSDLILLVGRQEGYPTMRPVKKYCYNSYWKLSLLLGTCPAWSNSGKIARLNKKQLCVCVLVVSGIDILCYTEASCFVSCSTTNIFLCTSAAASAMQIHSLRFYHFFLYRVYCRSDTHVVIDVSVRIVKAVTSLMALKTDDRQPDTTDHDWPRRRSQPDTADDNERLSPHAQRRYVDTADGEERLSTHTTVDGRTTAQFAAT